MLWFVHGLSFALIISPLFAAAVDKIKAAPGYKPCHRHTLSTSHLSARNEEANEYKDKRLQHGKQYGFLVTSDGWRNKARRSYHNFILVAANGPIFLKLKDVTGQAGNAKAISDEFTEVFATLDESVYSRIVIGCTDTPSANVMWQLGNSSKLRIQDRYGLGAWPMSCPYCSRIGCRRCQQSKSCTGG